MRLNSIFSKQNKEFCLNMAGRGCDLLTDFIDHLAGDSSAHSDKTPLDDAASDSGIDLSASRLQF